MVTKISLIILSFLLPPLGFLHTNKQSFFGILSLTLWCVAVYFFFHVSVFFGVIIHSILVFISYINIIKLNSFGNLSFFNKKSLFLILTTIFIMFSIVFMFLSRINEAQKSSIKVEGITNGKQLFTKCLACHRTTKEHFVGPHLVNIYGREVGSLKGYNYSDNMSKANFFWTDVQLLNFLTNQNDVIPGTRMVISPMPKKDILDIIEYLKSK